MKQYDSIQMQYLEQLVETENGVLIRAPAKLNLCLLIAGKRPDGFHDLETVMAKVNRYDELLIEKKHSPGIEVICKGSFWAPEGKDNLVYKAASLILKENNIKANLKITLTKNIPAGSGLGSASSDAAATLMGLNRLLELNNEFDRLSRMAERLGSDVCFFLGPAVSFCTGKGEKLQKIQKPPDFLALIVIPEISISTKKVYENYKHEPNTYNTLHRQIKPLLEKNRIDLIMKMCVNMLLKSSLEVCGELKALKSKIESVCGKSLSLSGSGSSLFYLFNDHEEKIAKVYQDKIQKSVGCKSFIVNSNKW